MMQVRLFDATRTSWMRNPRCPGNATGLQRRHVRLRGRLAQSLQAPRQPHSVNDDRQAIEVMGIKRWIRRSRPNRSRIRTGKDAWNRKVSGVFFCFLNRDECCQVLI